MTAGNDISRKAIANASETVRRLNPDLFSVGEFHPKIGQQKDDAALGGKSSGRKAGAKRVGSGVRVSLISVRHRELDSDNLIAGQKPLRDAIARSMALDDGDGVIDWEYGQQLTRGPQGTIVTIIYEQASESDPGRGRG